MTGVSEAEGLRKPSVSRIVRMALLTRDIVEAILAGRGGEGGERGRAARGRVFIYQTPAQNLDCTTEDMINALS